VTALLGAFWGIVGFRRISIGWQVAFGVPLLLVLHDYLLVMLGKGGIVAVIKRRLRR